MKLNQHQIDEILNSLTGIRRAEAPAFLLTRIEAEIDAPQRVSGLRAAFAAVGLAALLAVNVWVIALMVRPQAGSSTTAAHIVVESNLVDNFQLYNN